MNRLALLFITLALVTAVGCGGNSEKSDEMPAEQTAPEEETSEETETRATEEASTEEADDENLPATADPNAPADVAAPPADASTTESGLAFKILKEGTGDATPTTTSMVRVHYTGWTTDGVKFDSSVDRGEPAEFPLDKVIPGWTEGVSLMKVGEKRRLWIPVELAYNNRPDRPQGMLVFDVELLAIVK